MNPTDTFTLLEWSATATTALSVWLAARRHIATWPIGIVGCLLYGALFMGTQLYADATLQVFFTVTGVIGWRQWRRDALSATATASVPPHAPLRRMQWTLLLAGGMAVTLLYGVLLLHWTDAFAPFWDSAVLTTSVVAQVLLMQGRRETWLFWIVVNTLSVPLYLSRGLDVTAGLYALFWLNAWHGWWHWRRRPTQAPAVDPAVVSA
jgi:nicotinamide mononucleotide transporter